MGNREPRLREFERLVGVKHVGKERLSATKTAHSALHASARAWSVQALKPEFASCSTLQTQALQRDIQIMQRMVRNMGDVYSFLVSPINPPWNVQQRLTLI
jgi:hypothetical protein